MALVQIKVYSSWPPSHLVQIIFQKNDFFTRFSVLKIPRKCSKEPVLGLNDHITIRDMYAKDDRFRLMKTLCRGL
jgi:hypothetical protein